MLNKFQFKKIKESLKKGSGVIVIDDPKKNLFWVSKFRIGQYNQAEDATSTKAAEYSVSPALVAVVVLTLLAFTLIVEIL